MRCIQLHSSRADICLRYSTEILLVNLVSLSLHQQPGSRIVACRSTKHPLVAYTCYCERRVLCFALLLCCRFIERRPGYALAAALVVATGTSTMFSLWWPFPPDEAKELNMTHLADAKYGALVRVEPLALRLTAFLCSSV